MPRHGAEGRISARFAPQFSFSQSPTTERPSPRQQCRRASFSCWNGTCSCTPWPGRRDMNRVDEEFESLAAGASLFDRRDREKVRHYASFVAGSVRRHRFLTFAVFASIVGATVGALVA